MEYLHRFKIDIQKSVFNNLKLRGVNSKKYFNKHIYLFQHNCSLFQHNSLENCLHPTLANRKTFTSTLLKIAELSNLKKNAVVK